VGKTVKLKLRSRIGYVDLVHEMTEDLARGAQFPKAMALDLALAVREAFINAVKHGNGMDEAKKVEVEFERNANRFRVWVRDQGKGFDWDHTSDPRAAENISRSTGRGIFFMKHFVDSVSFMRLPGRGTEVLLEKRMEPTAISEQAIKRRRG
jgi:serine/threonine-protein kinase RsbW